MSKKDLSQLSDQELLEEFKKTKPSPVFDAFFIGVLIGVIIYGAASNAWGFLFILPLTLIYLFLKKSKRYNALKQELYKRKIE